MGDTYYIHWSANYPIKRYTDRHLPYIHPLQEDKHFDNLGKRDNSISVLLFIFVFVSYKEIGEVERIAVSLDFNYPPPSPNNKHTSGLAFQLLVNYVTPSTAPKRPQYFHKFKGGPLVSVTNLTTGWHFLFYVSNLATTMPPPPYHSSDQVSDLISQQGSISSEKW